MQTGKSFFTFQKNLTLTLTLSLFLYLYLYLSLSLSPPPFAYEDVKYWTENEDGDLGGRAV